MIKQNDLRFNTLNTCGECARRKTNCRTGTLCEPVRHELRPYGGIRFTSDGFDCALPVTIDSHSVCSYECLYCFSDNLTGHTDAKSKPIGQTSLNALERIFAGEGGVQGGHIRTALRYHKKRNGYPCPVQLGGINDPCDNIERQQGWLLRFIDLAIKYNQPVRISTKGVLLMEKDYLAAISKAPHLFWVAFSIITPDDELLEKIDLRAPNATKRLACMAALSAAGVKTSLRFRPILAGISDSTKNEPKAYKTRIEKAAAAGARAISYEVGFYPSRLPSYAKGKWDTLERLTSLPLKQIYQSFGKNQTCLRASYKWTENIMHAIYDEAKKNKLTVGVSDPCWKQLTESGCCCGILPEDEVFGNWEVENATNWLLKAKNDRNLIIKATDIIPEWAYHVKQSQMFAQSAGPLSCYNARHAVWSEKLLDIWNNPKAQRSPLEYFQGALVPVKLPNGELGYKYKGLERRYPSKIAGWKV